MCEKIVSLIRFSFENDSIIGLANKIRHFYDIHFMLENKECRDYLKECFPKDLIELITHDKAAFDYPPLWKESVTINSILFTNFNSAWNNLVQRYVSELCQLTYGKLPKPEEIANSIKPLMEYVKSIIISSKKAQ